jgi:hypothetical protein
MKTCDLSKRMVTYVTEHNMRSRPKGHQETNKYKIIHTYVYINNTWQKYSGTHAQGQKSWYFCIVNEPPIL